MIVELSPPLLAALFVVMVLALTAALARLALGGRS